MHCYRPLDAACTQHQTDVLHNDNVWSSTPAKAVLALILDANDE